MLSFDLQADRSPGTCLHYRSGQRQKREDAPPRLPEGSNISPICFPWSPIQPHAGSVWTNPWDKRTRDPSVQVTIAALRGSATDDLPAGIWREPAGHFLWQRPLFPQPLHDAHPLTPLYPIHWQRKKFRKRLFPAHLPGRQTTALQRRTCCVLQR